MLPATAPGHRDFFLGPSFPDLKNGFLICSAGLQLCMVRPVERRIQCAHSPNLDGGPLMRQALIRYQWLQCHQLNKIRIPHPHHLWTGSLASLVPTSAIREVLTNQPFTLECKLQPPLKSLLSSGQKSTHSIKEQK